MAQPQVSAVGSVNDGGQGGGGAAASGGGNADSSQAVESQQQQTTSGAPRGGALGVGARPENKFASSSLYVGDLSKDVTEATLFELFNAVGPVASIRVCRDGATRQSLGYAYVNFHSTKDAERALDTMNFANIKGKQCRIMWSQRDPTLRRSNKGNVFVKRLHESIDNKTLYDTFSVFGNILSCKVATNEDGSSRQYGYVHYVDEASAKKAIEGVNGMSINNQVVQACAFQPRKERAKTLAFTNVYVKYIPRHCDEAMCKDAFIKIVTDELKLNEPAEITHSKFWVAPFGVSGCFNFATHEQAKTAVSRLNGFDLRKVYPDLSENNNNDENDDGKAEEKDGDANDDKDKEERNEEADDGAVKSGDGKENENKDDKDKDGSAAADENEENDEDKNAAIVSAVAGKGDIANKSEHRCLFATRAEKRKARDFHLAKEKGFTTGYRGRGRGGGGGGGYNRYYAGGNLYVKHLKPDVDDEKLKEMFAPYGEIQSARVMKDQNGQSRMFGFVAFKTKQAATRALHEMGLRQQGPNSKPLYVSRAQSRQARNKRFNSMNRGYRGRGGGGYNMYQGPFSSRGNMGDGGNRGGGYNQYRNNYTPSGGIYGMPNQGGGLGGMPNQGPVGGGPGMPGGMGGGMPGGLPGGIGGLQGQLPGGLQQGGMGVGRGGLQQGPNAQAAAAVAATNFPMQQMANPRMGLPYAQGVNLMNQAALLNRGPQFGQNPLGALQQLFPQGTMTMNPQQRQQIGNVGGLSQGMNPASALQSTNFNPQQTSQTNLSQRVNVQSVAGLQSASAQMQSVPRGGYSVHSGGVVGAATSQIQTSQPTHTASMPQGGQSTSVLSTGGGRDSAAMKESHPLTQQMLNHINTPAEKKRLIGERLFPKIQVVEPRLAGKITGMLLEMDNKILLTLLNDNTALHSKINEALAVLQEHHKSQQNASNANRTSASNNPQ